MNSMKALGRDGYSTVKDLAPKLEEENEFSVGWFGTILDLTVGCLIPS